MKLAAAVLSTLVLAALMAFTPPRPKPVANLRLSAVRDAQSATTIWIKGCWTASGGPDGFTDSLKVTGGAAQAHTLGVVACDSFSVAAPAPGSTKAGTFAVLAKRRGLFSAPVSLGWTYTEPDVPPPPVTLDSLKIKPIAWTGSYGQTHTFCALGYMSDGSIRNASGQETIPTCIDARNAAIVGL